ncbi:CHC2 zinc finger domain-containing protein [Neobacillus pocheonensis]|uniref:CHC2 zinc finger domain-containing protein n=1 Tax=Neobacillus pocheonensis TaxID=363869 RepID=UPI003D2D89A9
MSSIDLIKENITIIDVLDRYSAASFANAKTSRSRFNIRCPFHNDRNPSFTVYTDTNTFRCWSGCNDGKSGDVVDIVKLSRNLSTKEAIKILIDDYGLEKPDSKRAKELWKKRASRERLAALKKVKNKKVIEAIDALRELEQSVRTILASIRSVEDLDLVGELYHVVNQIDYWFECLVENQDIECQIQALQEVSSFLQNMKEGKGA